MTERGDVGQIDNSERPHVQTNRFPRRYIFACVLAFGPLTAFWVRTSWTVALNYMIKPSRIFGNITRCNKSLTVTSDVKSISDEYFYWDASIRNVFTISFQSAYILIHIPAGVVADLYGGKHILGFSVLTLCFIDLAAPLIIRQTEGNVVSFVVLTVLSGFAAGTILPCVNALLSNWTPFYERGRMGSIVFAAPYFALSVSSVSLRWMIEVSSSWETVFYFFGAIGIIWFFVWYSYFHSKPSDDIRVSVHEVTFLEEELRGLVTYGKKPMKWGNILTSLPIWALTASTFGHIWVWQIMANVVPIYQIILGTKIKDSYHLASILNALMVIVILANGYFVDYVTSHGGNITTVRKVYTIFASMGPAVFLVASAYPDCRNNISIAFFIMAMSLLNCFVSGNGLNTLDLAPNYSGTIMGITNGIGSIASVVAININHKIAPDNTQDQWVQVFWLYAGVLTLTCLLFIMFGTGETQRWNNITASQTDNLRLKPIPPPTIGEIESETTWSTEISESFIK